MLQQPPRPVIHFQWAEYTFPWVLDLYPKLPLVLYHLLQILNLTLDLRFTFTLDLKIQTGKFPKLSTNPLLQNLESSRSIHLML